LFVSGRALDRLIATAAPEQHDFRLSSPRRDLVEAHCRSSRMIRAAGPRKEIEQRIRQMDKDRIAGTVKQAKGAVKEAAGKVTGDAKLETEGKADKVAGKVQNAVGGARDAVKGE